MLIMENYIDPSFIVTAGTIISYSGKNPVQEIPGKPGNIRISAIGDAAFMESQALHCSEFCFPQAAYQKRRRIL